MRALVTGATGFIGSYLTKLLVKAGKTVAILRRHSSNVSRIQEILSKVVQIESDLRALSEVENQILEFAPDTIFHLAWYGVSNRFRNDQKQIENNLYNSLNLLRLALRSGCQTWIGLGSQAEYGPQNKIISENIPTNPTTLYGAVKLCTYLLGRQIVAGSRMRFVWLRLFSSYGPKDNADWMIPYLIETLLRGKKPSLTLGEQKWDYLYVEDAVRAIYRTAVARDAKGVYNLGSGEAYTVKSIAERIRDLINPELPLGFGEVPYRPDQIMHLQADISRLHKATGWSPQVSLDEGLRRTVKWFRENKRLYENES